MKAPAVDAAMSRVVPVGTVHAELVGQGEPAPGTSATDPASAASCAEAAHAAEREGQARAHEHGTTGAAAKAPVETPVETCR